MSQVVAGLTGRAGWRARRCVRVMLYLAVLVLCASASSAQADTQTAEGNGMAGSSPLQGSLLVPEMRPLAEQQVSAAEEAQHSSPEAVAARTVSQTAFEGLPAERAATLAAETFPSLINHPAGGPPRLPDGQHITDFIRANAAQVYLGGGALGVLESVQPIATKSSQGKWMPVNLGISETEGGLTPVNPVVGLKIPKHLQEGVSLAGLGVSLAPANASGTPVGGAEGHADGAVAFFGGIGVGSDVDELVKPTTTGFSEDAVLRSQLSPDHLFYRVGMPAGANLEAAPDKSGDIDVVDHGTILVTILAPSARDATGAPVPASMSFAGHTLSLSISQSSQYQLPIVVDPEVTDNQLVTTSGGKRTNWEFHTSNTSRFGSKAISEGGGKEYLETYALAKYEPTEWAYWGYQTKGNSKIYDFNAETEAKNSGAHIESFLELEAHGTGSQESKELLSTEAEKTAEYSRKAAAPICPKNGKGEQECLPTAGGEGNAIHFQQSATASGSSFSDFLYQGIISLAEPSGTHSTTSYNTSAPTLEFEVETEGKKEKVSRANALYGAGSWLSKYAGAAEFIGKDPGIGVAATRLEYETAPGKWEQLPEHNYLEKENDCQGVQCYPEHQEFWTLNEKLPNGEDKIRYRAEDAMHGTESLESEGNATVKVDSTPPRKLIILGLPYGNELSERPYKLTVEATDGEGSTVPSSGMKSLELAVDKHVLTKTGGSGECSVPKGSCTASEEWTINGSELGAGHHAVVIVARDAAGNEARREETITVRHSTPVALGPGAVDLESGDFTLGGSDVSMGSGLNLSRTYSSRDLTQGNEGPLGPQWSLSMASTESLVELVDGSVLMTAANGSQTIFAGLGEGKFESPTGDSNLELTLEENKETKQKAAYYLKDNTAGTNVKFTLPSGGTTVWVPTKQEGTAATDTLTYTYRTVPQHTEYALPTGSNPYNVVEGPDKKLWFTDYGTKKIGKITTAGTVTEYAVPSGSNPYDITAGPDGNLWFTEPSANKIGKITTSGTVTEYSLPAGSTPYGITAGPDGNVWFTAYGTNKVGKVTSAGAITEYALPAGSSPFAITSGRDGNLWVADLASAKIAKVTTSGTVTEYAVPSGGLPYGIAAGSDGNLWFIEDGKAKIGKITTSGTVTEYARPAGTNPSAIAAGPDGNIWFTELASGRLGKVTTAGTITESSLPSGAFGIAAGPDGNLWLADYYSSTIGKTTTSGTITEPTEALAPVPAGVSCSPTLTPGCRALKFKYAIETTASGNNKAEWGEYSGHLTQVLLDAYNPASKTMQETPVAEYSYDKQGRLRAEWDPRLSSPLKTTYGYDEEGHITGMTPPGHESWVFTYGTSVGDAGLGRLIKATQAPASAGLWNGELAQNTEAPVVTGSPVVGAPVSVSNGKWSNEPVAYAYAWEDCGTSGECTPIIGGDNPSYTPTLADAGATLMVKVSALNGDGSAVHAVTAGVVKAASEYALPTGSNPYNVVEGPDKKLWFTDYGTKKIGKITTAGTVTEYAVPSGSNPYDITAGPDGNLWFTEPSANKIGKITTSGTVTEYSLPAGSTPYGITAGPDGNVWFTAYGTNKVGKVTSAGAITEYALPAGSSPFAITSGRDGNLWVADLASAKIAKVTTSGTVTEYAVPSGGLPYGIAAGSDGNLWFIEDGKAKIGKITTSGTVTEYARPAGTNPSAIAAGPDGNIWFTELASGRLGKVTTAGTITESSLPSGAFGIAAGPDGNLWLADYYSSTIGKVALTPVQGEPHPQPGWTMEYNVPVSGTGAPHNMSEAEVANWGQTDDPVEATAIFPPDEPQSWPATRYIRATVDYLDEQGRLVNTATPSTSSYGAIATREFNESNDVIRTLSDENRVTALEAGSTHSAAVSKLLDTQNTYNGEGAKEGEVAEPGTKLIETLGPQHMIKYVAGKETKESLARSHTKYFYDEGAKEVEEKTHETYNLLTKTTNLAQLANEEEVEVRKTTNSYSGQENLGWKLRAATSTIVDPEGKKLTHETLYNKATGQVTESRTPEGLAGESAHDTRTIYYSSAANTEGYPSCGKHPEWAGLVCETLPAKQPETSGPPHPPKLPITTTTYNMWNEAEITEEALGTTTRTKKNTYDAAGRLASSEKTSTSTQNVGLPKVTNEYNAQTGALVVQSTTSGGKTQTVTSTYNKLGQLESYTDADGNTSKYTYGGAAIDNQVEEVSDAQGKRLYSYEETTKALSKLWVSGGSEGLNFTASYNVEGKLTSETYPNGMCANYTYNPLGEVTGLAYVKTTNCGEAKPPVWYSESLVSSVHGEVVSRENTLGSDKYVYDTAARLTEAQETPTGEGCKVRIYAYDEESNRTSLTSREPNSKHECATEGGTIEKHSYDEGGRLTDAGIEYDSLGNIVTLPAADAGEGGELKSSFYADNQIATQSQNGEKLTYEVDPTGRVRRTVGEGKTASTVISHYDAPGEGVAWSSEGSEKWTRDITGIDGTLSAVESSGSAAVLQLHDLNGNIVATAALSSSETKLLSTYRSTEFGVPSTSKPPKYAFQGATGAASELGTGVITYGATSYDPQAARPLQSEEVEPPGLPNGSGGGAAYTAEEEPWNMQGAAREGAEAPGLEAGREREAEEAACRANIAACSYEYGGDPEWIWHLSVPAAEALSGSIDGYKAGDELSGLLDALKAGPIKYIESWLFKKFTTQALEDWAFTLAERLDSCLEGLDAHRSKTYKPQCRVAITTETVAVRPWHFGPVLFSFELPDLSDDPVVSYCEVKGKWCYEV
jgi:YD repeat-containing protein